MACQPYISIPGEPRSEFRFRKFRPARSSKSVPDVLRPPDVRRPAVMSCVPSARATRPAGITCLLVSSIQQPSRFYHLKSHNACNDKAGVDPREVHSKSPSVVRACLKEFSKCILLYPSRSGKPNWTHHHLASPAISTIVP